MVAIPTSIRVHNGQIVADDFTPPELGGAAATAIRQASQRIACVHPALAAMPGMELAKRRAPHCSQCELGREDTLAGTEICARRWPEADCYCAAKIGRVWPAHLAWLNDPESCCPHPEAAAWGPETVAAASVEDGSMVG